MTGKLIPIALLAAAGAAWAQEAREIAVPTQPVWSASSESSSVLGIANAGEKYVVKVQSGSWLQVFWAGNLGWIPSASTEVALGTGVEILSSTVNVRSGSSTTASIVGQAHKGEVYVQISKSGAWRRIWFGGAARWVHGGTNSSAYELSSGTAGGLVLEVNFSVVTVRSAPDSSASSVGQAFSGQRFVRIGGSGPWNKIWYGHGTAWVDLNQALPASNQSAVTVLAFSTPVRSAPSEYAQALGHVHAGQAYARVSVSSGWVQISFRDGFGWVVGSAVSAEPTITKLQLAGSPKLSGDGRFVAFTSATPSLVWNDTNGAIDVFVRDAQTSAISRVSVWSGGGQGAGASPIPPSITSNGRYVAFVSAAKLAGGDGNAVDDVYVHDRQTTTTTLVTPGGNGPSSMPDIAADGSCIAFTSKATNLVSGDTNGTWDVFVRTFGKYTVITSRVSVAWDGSQANSWSDWPSVSEDGRYVAFYSMASNLVPGDANARMDVFVRDRVAGTTERVSVASGGTEGNGHSRAPAISANGRFVAFLSEASNLVWGDTNASEDVFVRDRLTGITSRISVASDGTQGYGRSGGQLSLSADGRYVAFLSEAPNLISGDTNGKWDAFVRDRVFATTTRVSQGMGEAQLLQDSLATTMSADGRSVGLVILRDGPGQPGWDSTDILIRRRW